MQKKDFFKKNYKRNKSVKKILIHYIIILLVSLHYYRFFSFGKKNIE